MRAETAAYKSERKKWATQPRLFLRAYHIPAYDSTQEWSFARDFSSGPVVGATTEKLVCIRRAAGNPQRVDPIAGTSDIGILTVELVNLGGEILRYIADPALPLSAALTTTPSDPVKVLGDGNGYPRKGTLQIQFEDITYTGYSFASGETTFTGITRASRGTTIAAHAAGILVRNGEQLRAAQRVTLFLGYAPLDEEEYGPGPGYVKMAIEALDSQNAGQTWTLRAADIQRFVKQSIFTSATPDAPAAIGPEHPLTIALKVLTSTGAGVNGAYDVLPSSQGAHVPNTLVNVENFEFYRDAILPGLQMRFSEIEADDAKAFIEQQCLRPLNLVPFISQRGRYGVRLQRTPLFVRTGLVLPQAVVGTAA
jgi:hypothetical protein